MATKRMTCPLGFWQDPKTGKMRRLKYHKCDATCSMTQRECMDVVRTQGFWVPSGRKVDRAYNVEETPRRYVVSQLVPSPKCEHCGGATTQGGAVAHAGCRRTAGRLNENVHLLAS